MWRAMYIYLSQGQLPMGDARQRRRRAKHLVDLVLANIASESLFPRGRDYIQQRRKEGVHIFNLRTIPRETAMAGQTKVSTYVVLCANRIRSLPF